MKKMIVIAFAALNCVAGIYCFGDENLAKLLEKMQCECRLIEDNGETNEARREVIKSNINFITSLIKSKIEKAQRRIDKYRVLIDSTHGEMNTDDVWVNTDQWVKKINSKEKEIQNLNELLFAIDVLKLRIKY